LYIVLTFDPSCALCEHILLRHNTRHIHYETRERMHNDNKRATVDNID